MSAIRLLTAQPEGPSTGDPGGLLAFAAHKRVNCALRGRASTECSKNQTSEIQVISGIIRSTLNTYLWSWDHFNRQNDVRLCAGTIQLVQIGRI
jgi:hypothetical protein